MVGTVAFTALQMNWYRKFYKKMLRANREIEVDIDEDLRRKSYLSVIGIWKLPTLLEIEISEEEVFDSRSFFGSTSSMLSGRGNRGRIGSIRAQR